MTTRGRRSGILPRMTRSASSSPPAVVHHREYRVGLLHGRPRPFDADALHRIVGRVQARGIHDLQGEPVHLHRLVEGVPGRARHLGHDRPLPSHQSVQQARLAHVGTPHDHHPEPFAEQVAAGRGPPRRRHRGPDPAEPLGEQRLGQVRDLLVGKVEGPSTKVRISTSSATAAFTRSESAPSSERRASRAASCVAASMRSATASAWARSSLPLRNARSVNSPGPGRARAEGEHPAGHPVEDHRPAVALELQRVLAGIGIGAGKPEGDSGVEGLAVAGEKPGGGRRPGLGEPAHHAPRHLRGAGPAHPHDPDPAPARRGGDGGDGVRHPPAAATFALGAGAATRPGGAALRWPGRSRSAW